MYGDGAAYHHKSTASFGSLLTTSCLSKRNCTALLFHTFLSLKIVRIDFDVDEYHCDGGMLSKLRLTYIYLFSLLRRWCWRYSLCCRDRYQRSLLKGNCPAWCVIIYNMRSLLTVMLDDDLWCCWWRLWCHRWLRWPLVNNSVRWSDNTRRQCWSGSCCCPSSIAITNGCSRYHPHWLDYINLTHRYLYCWSYPCTTRTLCTTPFKVTDLIMTFETW